MTRLLPAGGGSSVALRKKTRTKSSKTSSDSAKSSKGSAVMTTLTDPKKVLRLVTAAKVAGPLLAAGAMKASTTVRGLLDEKRAEKLGVPVESVAAYKGPAGPSRARIIGLTAAIADLRARRSGEPAVVKFTNAANARLVDLTAALDATASMPPGTQRAAIRAVATDLNQIDAELMTFLVGPPTS